MKQSKWSIQHENGNLILVARNCITFRLTDSSCLITLIDAFYFFEVHIAADTPLSVCREVCPTIQKEILSGINAACEKLHYANDCPHLAVFCPLCTTEEAASPSNNDRPYLAVLCPCCTTRELTSPSSHDNLHAAVLKKDDCVCIETSRHAPLTESHSVWLANQGIF